MKHRGTEEILHHREKQRRMITYFIYGSITSVNSVSSVVNKNPCSYSRIVAAFHVPFKPGDGFRLRKGDIDSRLKNSILSVPYSLITILHSRRGSQRYQRHNRFKDNRIVIIGIFHGSAIQPFCMGHQTGYISHGGGFEFNFQGDG